MSGSGAGCCRDIQAGAIGLTRGRLKLGRLTGGSATIVPSEVREQPAGSKARLLTMIMKETLRAMLIFPPTPIDMVVLLPSRRFWGEMMKIWCRRLRARYFVRP